MTMPTGNFTAAEARVLAAGAAAYKAAMDLATELGVTVIHLHDTLELQGPSEACERVQAAYLAALQEGLEPWPKIEVTP